ncbi:MAG: hypothetical protein ACEPOZ_11955 [Marinifilaceae bacterium]
MRIKEKKQSSRSKLLKDKMSKKPQFRPPHKKYSPFDHFEDWTDIQTTDDWSAYTADGPYYEIDEEDRIA